MSRAEGTSEEEAVSGSDARNPEQSLISDYDRRSGPGGSPLPYFPPRSCPERVLRASGRRSGEEASPKGGTGGGGEPFPERWPPGILAGSTGRGRIGKGKGLVPARSRNAPSPSASFAGDGKNFFEGKSGEWGFLLLSFWGRRQTHSSRGGLFFDTASRKASIKLLRGSIGRGVFRGFWLNLPGILAKLFHFSGDSG